MEYSDHLVHHGILKQRWGVRRFQNPDGSWTQAGLERRRSNYKYKMNDEERAKYKKRYKFLNEEVLDSDYDIYKTAEQEGLIKKGTPLYRASSNKNETIDESRKYASITQVGSNNYIHYLRSNMLFKGDDEDKSFTEYRYEASKDLKVASPEIMKDEAKKLYAEEHPIVNKFLGMILDEKDWQNKSLVDVQQYINDHDYNHENKFYKRMGDLGYDVITDVYDLGINNEFYFDHAPMIFLKPYESMKLTDAYDLEVINEGKSLTAKTLRYGIENSRSSGYLDPYKLSHSIFCIYRNIIRHFQK